MKRVFLGRHFDDCDNYETKVPRLPPPDHLPLLLPFILLFDLLIMTTRAHADLTQFSGGLDARTLSTDPLFGAGSRALALHTMFANIRHVISDDSGDRYVLVGQIDVNDNVQELEPYQVYAQVKGPLGRINVRTGRYILPFGLLANLDTERQLIHTHEPVTLGIKLDTGVQVFGFTRAFDYAISVSQGTGEIRDPDDNKLFLVRLGMQSEDWRGGISYLDGRIDTDEEDFLQEGSFDRQRLALDLEIDFVPWLLRGELIAGKDDSHSVYGATLLADYDVNAKLAINTKLAGWNGEDDVLEVALGLSYRLPRSFILRAADTYQRVNGSGEHIVALQLSWQFSHAL